MQPRFNCEYGIGLLICISNASLLKNKKFFPLFFSQLDKILNSKSEPWVGEEHVASLTAWNRTKWAKLQKSHFEGGINAVPLHTIESAAFIVSLDDDEYESVHVNALDHFGKSLLHGNGHNRWFDKNFILCVGTNGRMGFNAEHTW